MNKQDGSNIFTLSLIVNVHCAFFKSKANSFNVKQLFERQENIFIHGACGSNLIEQVTSEKFLQVLLMSSNSWG